MSTRSRKTDFLPMVNGWWAHARGRPLSHLFLFSFVFKGGKVDEHTLAVDRFDLKNYKNCVSVFKFVLYIGWWAHARGRPLSHCCMFLIGGRPMSTRSRWTAWPVG